MMSGSLLRRVAIVTHTLDGGVWTMTQFLQRALVQSERYSVDVIVLATSACDVASVRLAHPGTWRRGVRVLSGHQQGIPYQLVGANLVEFEFLRYQPRPVLAGLLRDYDLVQVVAGTPAWAWAVHDTGAPICLFTATTARQERTSRIAQSTGWRKFWLTLMTRITSSIEGRALSSVECVFAESEYTLGLLSGMVEPERLRLAVPGVDTSFFCSGAYRPEGYLLAVGRFQDPRKNVRLLFDAYLRLLMLNGNELRPLIVAGQTGPGSQDWAYAESIGVAGHVQVHENVSLDQLRELYCNAALLVMSSDEEGLGLVILEAMASGLPVVSTHCGGPETAVLDGITGYLTPVGDSKALAKAIQCLLEDRGLRERMSQAARQRAEDCFSISAAAKVYLDEYDRLLRQ